MNTVCRENHLGLSGRRRRDNVLEGKGRQAQEGSSDTYSPQEMMVWC